VLRCLAKHLRVGMLAKRWSGAAGCALSALTGRVQCAKGIGHRTHQLCANCCEVFSLTPCLPMCTGHVLWTCPVHWTLAPDSNSREGVLGAFWAVCVHRTYPMLHQTCALDRSSREHVVVCFGLLWASDVSGVHRTCVWAMAIFSSIGI
jgi:hypothetical protein